MNVYLAGRALYSQKSNKQTRPFRLIFEVGAADPFLQIETRKEAHSTRISRRRLRFMRLTGK
jgi:hypothetical protein